MNVSHSHQGGMADRRVDCAKARKFPTERPTLSHTFGCSDFRTVLIRLALLFNTITSIPFSDHLSEPCRIASNSASIDCSDQPQQSKMAFEPLEVLEVPPLPDLNLELSGSRDQLVSSTFLSSPLVSSAYHVEPLSQDAPAGVDPVLESFTKRSFAADDHGLTPERPSTFTSFNRAPNSDIDLDSPGPSKRPLRRAASDSSLSTAASSIWDDELRPAMAPATVKFRGASAKNRVLDLAVAESISSGPQVLLEAIHDRLSSDATVDTQNQHLAPVHPTQQVLRSLVVTATTGTSSDHFQWDIDSASFLWAATLQHRKDVRKLRRLVKEQSLLHASLAAAGDEAVAPQDLPSAMTQPWIGSERIMGWSKAASDSVIRPFLDMGALLRRIDDRILAINRTASGLCNEAPPWQLHSTPSSRGSKASSLPRPQLSLAESRRLLLGLLQLQS